MFNLCFLSISVILVSLSLRYFYRIYTFKYCKFVFFILTLVKALVIFIIIIIILFPFYDYLSNLFVICLNSFHRCVFSWLLVEIKYNFLMSSFILMTSYIIIIQWFSFVTR